MFGPKTRSHLLLRVSRLHSLPLLVLSSPTFFGEQAAPHVAFGSVFSCFLRFCCSLLMIVYVSTTNGRRKLLATIIRWHNDKRLWARQESYFGYRHRRRSAGRFPGHDYEAGDRVQSCGIRKERSK